MSSVRAAWWKGARGEWYVAAQLVLFALLAFGPRKVGGWPARPFPFPAVASSIGAVLMFAGGLLVAMAALRLGRNLTPLPRPREEGTLVESGPYALVRHPIYTGALALGLGWGLLVHSWLTLVYALALFVLFDIKSRREERWLADKFPMYRDYQRRVRRLIPFVY